MKCISKILLVAGFATFLLHGCASAQEEQQNPVPEPAKMMGDIAIYDEFSKMEPIFQQKNDTTYVINFWATWCAPCVKELPYFEKLNQTLQDEKVKVILVSLDFPRQLETKLVPFVEEHDLRSEVVVLTDGAANDWIDQVSPQWSGAIPVTVVYNAQKRHFYGEEFASYEDLEKLVRAFL